MANPQVLLETNKGDITIELEAEVVERQAVICRDQHR